MQMFDRVIYFRTGRRRYVVRVELCLSTARLGRQRRHGVQGLGYDSAFQIDMQRTSVCEVYYPNPSFLPLARGIPDDRAIVRAETQYVPIKSEIVTTVFVWLRGFD